jgi:hypothetical protein
MKLILAIFLIVHIVIFALSAIPQVKSQHDDAQSPPLNTKPAHAEIMSEKSAKQDSTKSTAHTSHILKEVPQVEMKDTVATKKAAPPQPLVPPAKIFDALPEDILEQRVFDILGLNLKIESKLGIGGFGLVYEAILDDIEPRYISSRGRNSYLNPQNMEIEQDASDGLVPAGITYNKFSNSTQVAMKFFKKPKCVDFLRELHFHSRFYEYAEKTKDENIWDYFPKIIYSSNTRLPFLPEELDFDRVSSFSDSEEAGKWHPNVMPQLFMNT